MSRRDLCGRSGILRCLRFSAFPVGSCRLRRLSGALIKPRNSLPRLWVQRINPQRLLQTAPHIGGIVYHTRKPDPRIVVVLIRLDDAHEELPRQGALPGARRCNTLLEHVVRCCHTLPAPPVCRG